MTVDRAGERWPGLPSFMDYRPAHKPEKARFPVFDFFAHMNAPGRPLYSAHDFLLCLQDRVRQEGNMPVSAGIYRCTSRFLETRQGYSDQLGCLEGPSR